MEMLRQYAHLHGRISTGFLLGVSRARCLRSRNESGSAEASLGIGCRIPANLQRDRCETRAEYYHDECAPMRGVGAMQPPMTQESKTCYASR
jgi:hypothetical protein